MLSDRSYMRDADVPGRTSVLGWTLCATAAVFILQNLATRLLGAGYLLEHLFGLSIAGLHAGRVWTLVTYGLLHPQNDLLEILFIGLTVYFLGRDLLPVVGGRRFAGLYAGSLLLGGLFWTGVNWRTGGVMLGTMPYLGAAPAVTGLLAVFALLYPDREITVFILFIPVTVKPKYVALAVLAIDLFCCVFYEVLGATSPFAFGPSAHLGGMAAGWIYYRFFHERTWSFRTRTAVELPRWMKRTPPGAAAAGTYQVNLGNREHLKAEVDRILDKINSLGFGALTADEKRLLDEARDLLSRR